MSNSLKAKARAGIQILAVTANELDKIQYSAIRYYEH